MAFKIGDKVRYKKTEEAQRVMEKRPMYMREEVKVYDILEDEEDGSAWLAFINEKSTGVRVPVWENEKLMEKVPTKKRKTKKEEPTEDVPQVTMSEEVVE